MAQVSSCSRGTVWCYHLTLANSASDNTGPGYVAFLTHNRNIFVPKKLNGPLLHHHALSRLLSFQSLSRIVKSGLARPNARNNLRAEERRRLFLPVMNLLFTFCRQPFNEGVSKQHLRKQTSTGLNLHGWFSRRRCLCKKRGQHSKKNNSGGFGCIRG